MDDIVKDILIAFVFKGSERLAIRINARLSILNAVLIQLRNAPPATTRFCLVNLTLYTGLFLVGNALI